jgi:hypothetical protein
VPDGDQFPGSDQFALVAPVHVRVVAKREEGMKKQIARVIRTGIMALTQVTLKE